MPDKIQHKYILTLPLALLSDGISSTEKGESLCHKNLNFQIVKKILVPDGMFCFGPEGICLTK